MSSLQEKTEKLIVYGKSQLSSKGVESTATTIRGVLDDVANIQTGGITGTGQYLVQVVDYDGTVLKSDHLNTGDTFTLPEAPTHERLVFQGWSSPYNIVDNKVTVDNQDITIGPMYTTASGLSEFDITLTKVTGLIVTFNMVGNKNWGDGTSNSETTHTYANYGNYTITCDGTALPEYIMGQSSSVKNYTLRSVRLGSSINRVNDRTFQNCYSLTSITISSSVTLLGTQCLEYCYSLTSITLPTSVTRVISEAFQGCYSLTSIVIPNSVTSIESFAFSDCYSLTSVTIPNSVTSIGGLVFGNCRGLTSITIPEGVTSIGSSAFSSCSGLTSFSLPSSITSIGQGAFNGCRSLTSITIPSSVTSIGNNAFANCYSITKYDFSTATAVPTLSNASAFNNINAISKIIVPDALYDEWIAATNWTTYADYIYKVSEVYPPEPTPANYFKISDGSINGFSTEGQALYDAGKLTELVLPSSYSRGEEQEVTAAFESYDLLDLFMVENEFYPVTVQVGSLSQMFVFNNFDEFSDKYEQLYNESNFIVTYRFIPNIDGNDYAVTSIGHGAFFSCSSLTSITIPSSVTSIGNSTFANCSSLTSITIPKGVTSIGNRTFANCSSLTSIIIPEGITSIEDYTFFNCTNLRTITIPEGVTSIGNRSFAMCSNLYSVTLPSSLTSINTYGFFVCGAIMEVCNLSSLSMTAGSSDYGALLVNAKSVITDPADSKLSALNDYVIYNESETSKIFVKYVGNDTNIELPNTITSIYRNAFHSNANLISITIPESVTSIGAGAFQNCSSLTSIIIPEGVTSIEGSTFRGCDALTSIILPSSVTSIGDYAFYGCSSLTEITILSIVPPTLQYTFTFDGATITTIYIPAGTLEAYQTATNWSAFADKFVEM